MPQERRSYSKSFKAQVIAECAQSDSSIANVALTHNFNANLVHKWIRAYTQKNLAQQNAFIPVNAAPPIATQQVLPATIRVEVPHSKGVVVVSSLATSQVLNWVLPRSAAWPMHGASSSTCTPPTKARSAARSTLNYWNDEP